MRFAGTVSPHELQQILRKLEKDEQVIQIIRYPDTEHTAPLLKGGKGYTLVVSDDEKFIQLNHDAY